MDLAADLGVPDTIERSSDPNGLPRPAVRAQAPVVAGGHGPPVGIRVQSQRKCRAAQRDRVARLGEMQARKHFGIRVPLERRGLFHLVKIGRAEPREGGLQPVLERPRVAAPARERAADEQGRP